MPVRYPAGARRLAGLIVLVMTLVLAGCSGGGDAAPAAAGGGDADLVHVHGVGVNPADGAIYLATHTGLFRREGDGAPVRVTDRRQDTMGFTVVGPDHFLGSGHPDLRDDLPPLLGLIESRDAGRTWRPVSLLGEADFHVLRARGARVYGYDASGGRLLVSADRGRTWRERPVPGAVIDLAADPRRPRVLVAATPRGLVRTDDLGGRWTALDAPPGVLAWPRAGALHLVDGDGAAWSSSDGGRTWAARGHIGGAPAAFAAGDDGSLVVARHDGAVLRSRDGGRTWSGGGG